MVSSLKVMIIEDSEELVEVWRTLFRATTNYKLRCCLSGQAAREAIHGGFKPNLVITDYYLGDSTGVELFNELKVSLPDTKFVMVTGNHEDEEMLRLHQSGSFPLLLKPVKFDTLQKTINLAIS